MIITTTDTVPPGTSTWLTKVPVITATFWVIKVLSTTVGETFADFLTRSPTWPAASAPARC